MFIKREVIEKSTKPLLLKFGLRGSETSKITKEKALELFNHYFVEIEQETKDYIVLHAYTDCDMWC